MGRVGAPCRGDVAHAAQGLAHRSLPGGFWLHPCRVGNFAQGDAAVGQPVFDDFGLYRRLPYASLGVFIPLIVVNCIILGRAEAFASKNSPLDSILDGVGIGLGFTLALTAVGAVREILGSGAIFGVSLGTADYMPLIFVLAPGAFLVLGYLMVLFNKLAKK